MGDRRKVSQIVQSKIAMLSKLPENRSRAILASLRQGIGKKPGELPELWEITLAELNRNDGDYERRAPNNEEWAVYISLTLYGLHSQGKDKDINENGVGLGTALRRLITCDDDEKRIKRRLDAAVSSGDIEELYWHLKSLVHLLKAGNISLDYSKLSADIYWFMHPDYKNDVLLNWGRDFYKAKGKVSD